MTHASLLNRLSAHTLNNLVAKALDEDLGRAGDITGQALLDPDQLCTMQLIARETGILAGLDLAQISFSHLDPQSSFKSHSADGAKLEKGHIIATIQGNARAILAAERVALNFLSHLSGIASATHHFAETIGKHKAKITCTRKTTPSLRAIEKYAVSVGGGLNHRFGLDDAILIKDNHIALTGGDIGKALSLAIANKPHLAAIEIEVDTLDQLDQVLASKQLPDVIMLDNMDCEQLKEAVKRNQSRTILEASGGVTRDKIAAIAKTGVDRISSGWITHSAPALDIGLDFYTTPQAR